MHRREEARYAEAFALLDVAGDDPGLMAAMNDEIAKADEDPVKPLFQFRSYGIQLPPPPVTRTAMARD